MAPPTNWFSADRAIRPTKGNAINPSAESRSAEGSDVSVTAEAFKAIASTMQAMQGFMQRGPPNPDPTTTSAPRPAVAPTGASYPARSDRPLVDVINKPKQLTMRERYANAPTLQDFCRDHQLVDLQENLEKIQFRVGETLERVEGMQKEDWSVGGFTYLSWGRVVDAVAEYWEMRK